MNSAWLLVMTPIDPLAVGRVVRGARQRWISQCRVVQVGALR